MHCFAPAPDRILIFCRYPDTVPKEIADDVEVFNGLPTREIIESLNPSEHSLLIIDDLAKEAFASLDIANLYISGRHSNVSTIIITNILFSKERYAREISVNTNLFIIMSNPRDSSSIYALSYQLNPQNPRHVANMYFNYVQEPYAYLIIDLNPKTPLIFRYRNGILSETPEIFITETQCEGLENLNLENYGYNIEYLK